MAKTSHNFHEKVVRLVKIAVLSAVVIVLQLFGSYLTIGSVPVSLVLIPIVLGGVMIGPGAGTFLGFLFGLMTLIAGVTGTDAFTHFIFEYQPFVTVVLCIGKATAAGAASAWVYRLLSEKHRMLAVILAAATAPIVNTGIFVLFALTLLAGSLSSMIAGSGYGIVYFVLIVCAGVNFAVEFGVNLVVAPAIDRIRYAVSRKDNEQN